jgi:hypothetical protein
LAALLRGWLTAALPAFLAGRLAAALSAALVAAALCAGLPAVLCACYRRNGDERRPTQRAGARQPAVPIRHDTYNVKKIDLLF